ncbi:glycan-binding surface protein [Mucilaginibacter sp. 3215]|uniref:glycan-binding surface protein n=1 Tax=Mucilaginibacter sp. 3215 TaxID=3373912 RepID=UPI003D1BD482
MKKKSYLSLYFLSLLFMTVALLPACKKNNEGSSNPPVITSVRSYVASPNDTVLTSAVAKGQWVVITGQNLKSATRIEFDGVSASFNSALLAENSAVVQIPQITFSTIDTSKLYTLRVTTTGGATSFAFKLGPPAPAIYAISDVFANPGDSVYLFGANLVLVQHLIYGGTNIPKFNSSLHGDSLGFLMPALTPTKLVTVTTKAGIALDTINAKPIIYGISYVNPKLGDSVYVYGTYLKTVRSISFGGTAITNFTEGPHGAYVKFSAPDENSYSSGPVTIVTSYGTVSTVNKVNTQNSDKVGLLGDFEWGDNFGFGWGQFEHLTGEWEYPQFNGPMGKDHSQFMVIDCPKDNPVLAGGASVYIPLGNSNTGNHWVPVANIADPPANWALQFDISVAQPWKGGTLYIRTELGGDKYVARYEPWKIPNSNVTKAFITKGWETIIIPLSAFKSTVNELGDGVSITQISDLLGPTGANSYNMTLKNFGSSSIETGFYAAIDNIRCVKIK